MSRSDLERYERLLKGLEVSVVSFSRVVSGSETGRFDPEYFQKQHLAAAELVANNSSKFLTFSDLGVRVDSSAFYPAVEDYYDTGDLPFLRVADVDTVIDFESCTRIPAELCDRFPTLSRVHPGDIVFTKGGSVARIGLVTQEAAASRDLIFLDSSKLPEVDRAFLYIYVQTDFFNRMLLRSSSQTAQPHLTITLVRGLPAFRAGDGLKNQCMRIVQQAYSSRAEAIQGMRDAELMLTEALDLGRWVPQEPLTYTAPFAEAVVADRMDAEYHHPAKRDYLDRLGRGRGRPLGEHYESIRDMFDPTSVRGETMVRNFDLNDALSPVLDDSKAAIPASVVGSVKKRFKSGDVVTSRLRAYLRESALVQTSDKIPSVGSSEFIVLRPCARRAPALSQSALLTYLRSRPVQTILHWSQDGSHHPRYGEDDLLTIPIPDAVCKISGRVDKKIGAVLAARKRSSMLLDAAKRAVEIAIENSEATALKFLKSVGV
jgi:type I restriction enzyme, S subunit